MDLSDLPSRACGSLRSFWGRSRLGGLSGTEAGRSFLWTSIPSSSPPSAATSWSSTILWALRYGLGQPCLHRVLPRPCGSGPATSRKGTASCCDPSRSSATCVGKPACGPVPLNCASTLWSRHYLPSWYSQAWLQCAGDRPPC